jgi:histidinol-phosphate aminotransferase
MSHSFEDLVNPGVNGLTPYVPGRPIPEVSGASKKDIPINLASNENVLGASREAKRAAREAAEELHLYPDGGSHYLRDALADHCKVGSECLIVGNGSDDVLEMLAQSFLSVGRSAVFSKHAFIVYALATQRCGATALVAPARNWGHDLQAMHALVREDTRIIFIANPNNPTGSWVNHDELHEFMCKIPANVLAVVDEAYCEYVEARTYPNSLELQKKFRNLLITRTFSKIHGLAGLRVGYGIGDPEVIQILNSVRQPFNVNHISQKAAIAALKSDKHVMKSREMNKSGLKQISEGLGDMGIETLPSVANFVCFGAPLPLTDQELHKQLLARGVMVRAVGAVYDMPGYLRVTVGTSAHNRTFLRAMKQCMDDAI